MQVGVKMSTTDNIKFNSNELNRLIDFIRTSEQPVHLTAEQESTKILLKSDNQEFRLYWDQRLNIRSEISSIKDEIGNVYDSYALYRSVSKLRLTELMERLEKLEESMV